MSDRLFEGSLHSTWQNALRSAAEDVAKLDRKLFNDPSLGGALEKIANKYALNVATILKDKISAKAREEERDGTDSWGNYRRIKTKWLDVDIPFEGDSESFKIAPSHCTIPGHRARVNQNSLTLSIPDDANAQREVDTFVNQINENLARLRAEYEQMKPQLDQSIQNAAEQRKKQIQGEAEGDKNLSFPVKR